MAHDSVFARVGAPCSLLLAGSLYSRGGGCQGGCGPFSWLFSIILIVVSVGGPRSLHTTSNGRLGGTSCLSASDDLSLCHGRVCRGGVEACLPAHTLNTLARMTMMIYYINEKTVWIVCLGDFMQEIALIGMLRLIDRLLPGWARLVLCY